MSFLKSIFLFCLAITPYAILIGSDFVFYKVDFINFVILFLFLLLPAYNTGFLKIFLTFLVCSLYFILIFSINSFGGFLSFGAYASIMESNTQESLGYIQQFGLFPLVLSVFLTLLTFYVIFISERVRGLKSIHIGFLIISLLLIFPLYSVIKGNERLYNEYKVNPEGVVAGFYSRNIISPITNYLHYKREQSFLARPDSYELPENVNLGTSSRYNKIYLVVGESASRRSFSYSGYIYPTTPFVDSLRKDNNFHWVQNSISPSPITRDSLKRVLSFATAADDENYYKYINLVNAAKNKDFKTYWLSSQSPSGVHDTIIGRVGKSADYNVFNKTDDDLNEELNNNKIENEKQFFVIHLSGSHAPYNNYTDNDYNEMVELGSDQPEYDATIKKTDKILSEFVKGMSSDSLLIYLSDHGEVVGVGHGLNTPSKDQFDVPFFVYDTSGDIDEIIDFISKISVDNVFNIQMTMELVLKALGYEFDSINVPDPLEVYFSNGEVISYNDIVDEYGGNKK